MTQRPLQIASHTEHTAISTCDASGRARHLRYASVVVGPSADDVVAAAGGYMYDYARAGWDIIAACADALQSNALLVLGVTPMDLNAVIRESGPGMDRWSSEHTLDTHPAILGVTRELSHNQPLEVEVFRSVPPGLGNVGPGQMQHRLSTAARAFKQHALRYVREPVLVVDPTEMLTVRTISVV